VDAFHQGNLTLHYRIFGNGDPVIFLHGFLEDHQMWNSIAPKIEALGFKIILIDLPGHGLSRHKLSNCSMAEMALLLNGFCKAFSILNPFVFGHSMGGYVGLELLKLYSIKLTLIHSNFWEDSAEKKKDRNRFATIVAQNKQRLIQEVIPNLFAPNNRQRLQSVIDELCIRANKIPSQEIIASTLGMRDRLNNAYLLESHPISIVHGELDTVIKTNVMRQKLDTFDKTFPYHQINNVGHMSIWEDPDSLIKYIKMILFK